MDFRSGKHTWIIIALFFWLLLLACTKQQDYVDFNNQELIRLLSGDSTKEWVRVAEYKNGNEVNTDPCSLRLLYQFQNPGGTTDSLPLAIYNNPRACNQVDTLITSGIWLIKGTITNANEEDSIVMIFGNTVQTFGISNITSNSLKLVSVQNNDHIENDLEWFSP